VSDDSKKTPEPAADVWRWPVPKMSPGPWRWTGDELPRLRSESGHTIMRVWSTPSQVDARAIAAVPRMVELLKRIFANDAGGPRVMVTDWDEARALLRELVELP